MARPELRQFATMTITRGERFTVDGGPMGNRVIAEVETLEVTGEKLNASLAGKAAADWVTVGPDGTFATLDVRLTLRTDDGEIVFVEYGGRIDLASGRIVSAPRFQTGAEKYEWLNRIQAVAVGLNGPDDVIYELYEVVA